MSRCSIIKRGMRNEELNGGKKELDARQNQRTRTSQDVLMLETRYCPQSRALIALLN